MERQSRYPGTVHQRSSGEANKRYPHILPKARVEEIKGDMQQIIQQSKKLGPVPEPMFVPLPEPMFVPREALP